MLIAKTRFSSREHWKIGNQRRHFLHQLTYRLTDTFALPVEDVKPSFIGHIRKN